ncbi:oxidoreductase [Solwaraspora sp. WMMD791]|uniref:oxidoreductase n=1 Tax=Solwaraspora sp. WMMD791 TaxID=3016086 RepID=UPI002499C801|nr:oxidoreductase [Solwaraspora sp. WMMD791]WFE30370.1 oxidoreductase [Solwaraspora sp. WMMD791]
MAQWTFDDIPDCSGRTAVVTGANTGIGFETARMLAAKGAQVTLACRDADRAAGAAERIRATGVPGTVTCAPLDLADLDSVAAFAEAYRAGRDRLDLLINNAGVMAPPLGRTRQGFELQIGINHLGHFALTGRLLPLLLAAGAGARVVSVSSGAHRAGRIDFDDLNWQRRRYRRWAAYGQSKLANLLFTRELQRRLTDVGSPVRATAAHPGWTATELTRHTVSVAARIGQLVAMTPHDGALPTLRAATDPTAAGGSYWGPGRPLQLSGPPVAVGCSAAARDDATARRLWTVSEQLTGVPFPVAG